MGAVRLPSTIMIRSRNVVASILCIWCTGVGAQDLVSVTTAGGSGYDWGRKVAMDAEEDLVAVGIFESGCLMAGVPIPSYGLIDSYLVKFDPSGELLWTRHWGGPQDDYPGGLVLDEFDNIYVSGTIGSGFQLSDTAVVPEGGPDAFIAKFDPSGAMLWFQRIGGPGSAHSRCLSYKNGHLYAGGSFTGAAIWSNDTLQSVAATDSYLASWDTNGVLEWWHSIGGSGDEYLVDLAVDANDRVYGIASFDDSLSFGDTTLIGLGNSDMVVACWATSGIREWFRHVYSGGDDLPAAIDADSDGTTYVVAAFPGWTSMDPQVFSSYHDLMILKLDPSGQPVWAKFADSSFNFYGQDVSVGSDHHVFVSARFQNTAAFEGIPLYGSDPFIDKGVFLELDEVGALQWVVQTTGDGACHPESLLQLPDGDVLATGVFSGTVNFMDSVVQSSGSNDIFFLRLTSDGHVGMVDPAQSPRNGVLATILSPEQGIIIVRLDPRVAEFPARVDFMDLSGKCLFSKALVTSDTPIHLELPSGAYVARLTMGDVRACYRFIAM